MNILAIETSCDETSVAIVKVGGARRHPNFRVLEHLVASQMNMHAQFGGVVPNLAKREHERLLVPLTLEALKKAGMCRKSKIKNQKSKSHIKNQNLPQPTIFNIQTIFEREPELCLQFKQHILSLDMPDIDGIAVTNGPGLAPALWVGINFAKALSLIWRKPIIPVNHMKGHLFSALLQRGKKDNEFQIPHFEFPLIALLVSGGHTELVVMKRFGNYTIIGETLDDAAGEAFDKVARMLHLGYPGGPAISDQAEKNDHVSISHFHITLPRPMLTSKDYNFSFSGLKTAVLYALRDLPKHIRMSSIIPIMAKEFQDAVVDVLVAKTMRAVKAYNIKTVVLGGGVSANRLLRARLSQEVKNHLPRVHLFLPDISLTGDNALMIAIAAALDGKKKAPAHIKAEARIKISD